MDYNPRIGLDPGVYPEADPDSDYLGSGYWAGSETRADGGFSIEDIETALGEDTA